MGAWLQLRVVWRVIVMADPALAGEPELVVVFGTDETGAARAK